MKLMPLKGHVPASLLLPVILLLIPSPAFAAGESTSLMELLKMGGWAMWPLAAGSLLACHLAVAGSLELRRPSFLPGMKASDLRRLLGAEPFESVTATLRASGSASSRLLADTAEQAMRPSPALPPATALAEGLSRVEVEHSSRIQQLSVIAAVAPMIGLLGTVSGMIGAFQTISGGGMGKAELLAGDIGEALVTTAAGLMVGIPALIAHFLLRSKLHGNLARLAELGELLLQHAPPTADAGE